MSYPNGGATRRVYVRAGRPRFVLFAALAVTFVCAQGAIAQTLPSGWTGSNIGSPLASGRASYASGTFTVEGAGSDIWNRSDQFYFVHRQLTGDGTIVARVASIENTHQWAKAGVMIRESLAANSKYAYALVSPGKGIAFQRRTTTGGSATHTGVSGAAPVWLRVQRTGSTITASRSTNGTSWTTIGSATISMTSTVHVGLAVVSKSSSNLATGLFNNVTVSTALPAGWTAADIGSPAVRGSASSASPTAFTVSGAGADIWDTSDQFTYAYRQVSGDVDVIAWVASLQGTDAWSKAGVMVRASLSADSAHASLFASPSNGIAFQRRPATGMSSLHTSGGAGTAPVWVKLERRGSAVTAFRSADGSSWQMIDSQTLTLPSSFYVGLAVTSHNTSATATAQFINVRVAAPSAPVNTPPTVSLTAPAAGATYTAPASVTVSASASDTDGTISRVDFYAGSTLIGSDTTSPYSVSWSSVAAGSYSLTAVARDNSGATTTSGARSVTVSAGTRNQPPSVSLTAPASGATYTAPALMTVSASASDTDGTIARVDFYAGSTLIGSDTTSPYSISWSNVAAGSYSLTAVARDNAGAAATSAARSIIVNNPVAPGRAVFNPSTDHDTAVTRYRLDVFTAGANPSTATPMATQDLGKPAIVNGECSADIAATINGLPGGNYFATVVAIGPGGTSSRAVSANFTR